VSDVKKQDRDITKLSPEFWHKVRMFLADHRIKELWVAVSEALRTKERQEYLYSLGRTLPWPKRTWTLSSNHLTWNAIDIFCSDPKLWIYPEWMEWWREVFMIARRYSIKSLYQTYGIEKAHLENIRQAVPWNYLTTTKMYELFTQQLEAAINTNWVLWNLCTEPDLKEALEKMNKLLRSKRSKKD